jgi:hypothetical protein
MKKQPKRISPLAQVEIQALEEGREWTRRKIERDLQKLADQQGEFSPLKRPGADPDPPTPDEADHQRREG